MLVKYALSDGISQVFLPFRFVDVIVITVHDRFWNVGQANCILKYFENGRFYRENTCKCSPLVTKWQIILHFHCCFKYYIYHGSYELTYLNQRIRRMSWFK